LERLADLLRQSNAYLDLGRVLLWLASAQQSARQSDRAIVTLLEVVRHGRRLGCRPFSLAEGHHWLTLLTWGSEQLPQESYLHSWVVQLSEQPTIVLPQTAPLVALPQIEVRALGPGQVWRDGELLTTADWGRSANARELFFYVLEHAPSRKEDIGLNFWPELSTARMTSSFHAAKYRARRALGVEFVVYDDDRYCLNPLLALTYDVAEFRRFLEAGRLAATEAERAEFLRGAVQIYAEDYLTDVGAEWASITRAELHQHFFEALAILVTIVLRQHSYTEVNELCQRGLEIDFYHEDLHRALMVSLAATGRAAGALRHYDMLVKRLAQELRTSPAPATVALAARIRAGELPLLNVVE
jgi:DNA-binding SARP family transcriptional activator